MSTSLQGQQVKTKSSQSEPASHSTRERVRAGQGRAWPERTESQKTGRVEGKSENAEAQNEEEKVNDV